MQPSSKSIMDHVPGYIRDLIPYPPGKPMEELKRELGISDVIKMASNENALGPSPRAEEAVRAVAGRLHIYPDGSCWYLKEALARRFGCKMEEIVVGNGSNELIELLVRVFVRPGENVVTSFPSFLMYQKMVQAMGGENRVVPLKDFTHDLRAILEAVDPHTRIIFLDNPNNPTGSVLSREAIEEFLGTLPPDCLVVLDEAYMEFADPDSTVSGTAFLGEDERVVTLRTFSKAYGLGGLRLGYGIMAASLTGLLERVRQPFNVNAVAQAAGLAALEDKEHLEATLAMVEEGKRFFSTELPRLGAVVFPSHTNFILVDLGREAKGIYEAMLRQGVIIRPMTAYGFPNHVRITIGRAEENRRCLAALEKALQETATP